MCPTKYGDGVTSTGGGLGGLGGVIAAERGLLRFNTAAAGRA